MNPNNPAYTGSRSGSDGHDDNHANQLNPNNPGSSTGRFDSHDDNHANQLNPNNPGYWKSRGEFAENSESYVYEGDEIQYGEYASSDESDESD